MKYLLISLVVAGVLFASCKKDQLNNTDIANATVSADSFVFNTVTKSFSPQSTVQGKVVADQDIREIYYYLMRDSKTDSLIYIDTTLKANQKSHEFSIPVSIFASIDMPDVTGVKLMIKLRDNRTAEGIVKISSFTPSLPKLMDFPAEVDAYGIGDVVNITGKVSSEPGLKKIILEDNASGEYTVVDSRDDLNGVHELAYQADYTYRESAFMLRLTAEDVSGLSTFVEIKINFHNTSEPDRNYDEYDDVVMSSQGTKNDGATNCFYFDDAEVKGTCDITSTNETQLAFTIYTTTGNELKLYSPSNVSGIAKNYYCNQTAWAPDVNQLKQTKFRVLLPGGSSEEDAIYAALNTNNITDLDDAFFEGISNMKTTITYNSDESKASANVFNATKAYLIWVQIPETDGSFKNALIRAKSVDINVDNYRLSEITFDLLMQKK